MVDDIVCVQLAGKEGSLTPGFDTTRHDMAPFHPHLVSSDLGGTDLVTQFLHFSLAQGFTVHQLGDPDVWIFRRVGHDGRAGLGSGFWVEPDACGVTSLPGCYCWWWW